MTDNVTKIPNEETTRIDLSKKELMLVFECFEQSGFRSAVIETAASTKSKLVKALESFDE